VDALGQDVDDFARKLQFHGVLLSGKMTLSRGWIDIQ
jgi:hypothetical protein